MSALGQYWLSAVLHARCVSAPLGSACAYCENVTSRQPLACQRRPSSFRRTSTRQVLGLSCGWLNILPFVGQTQCNQAWRIIQRIKNETTKQSLSSYIRKTLNKCPIESSVCKAQHVSIFPDTACMTQKILRLEREQPRLHTLLILATNLPDASG